MRTGLATFASSIVAVGAKELRGRMRGPRAFIGVTLYLAVLAASAVLVYTVQRDLAGAQVSFGGGNPYVSAQVGQALFTALLFIQVLLVVFLAPAATSGAISLEREKQTLDLLAATPVSTMGIVIGKLASALAFVVVLIVASIPLTAMVFLFGGVAPEDVLRGYVVLIVTAIGFGSVGLLLSTLTRRTQTATVLTYLAVLILTVGTGFGLILEFATNSSPQLVAPTRDAGPWQPGAEAVGGSASPDHGVPWPPDLVVLLNPMVAAADVVCGMDVNPYSRACQVVASVTGRVPGGAVNPVTGEPPPDRIERPADNKGGVVGPGVAIGVAPGGAGAAPFVGAANVAADDPFASGSTRDSFWPQAAAAWLVTSFLIVLLSSQLVSPTRRWRLVRPRSRPEVRP
jgi:ABC-type transport system involved in multi-copper enzyme maturation permease subunit